MTVVIDDKTRAGFHNVAGKGQELPKDGGKAQPGAKNHTKPANNKAVKGDNNLQKVMNRQRDHLPEGHDANDYTAKGLQVNSYNNRMDPNLLESQRKMRENRRIQLKHAKDKIGVKTRLESSRQEKLKEGFVIGASKADRVGGMSVVNPELRSTVPTERLTRNRR